MIGKIPKPGKSFGGCILYNIQKHQAVVLDANGVRTDKPEHTIMDFNMQRKMNPGLGQAVGHISLSWSPHDSDKLIPEIMVEQAKEYLEKMKITNTQYLITQHKDRPHPHIHIVYNRVDDDAKTISDQFQKRRNVKVCKELTLKYGFYMSPGKEQVNRQRLTGADKIKYELFDAINQAAKQAKSWQELQDGLKRQGIGMQYKFRSGTTEVQGISFSKGAVKFKGSQVDRSLSYGRLNQQIEENKQRQEQLAQPAFKFRNAPLSVQSPHPHAGKILQVLLTPPHDQYIPDDPMLREEQKRKRKKQQRL